MKEIRIKIIPIKQGGYLIEAVDHEKKLVLNAHQPTEKAAIEFAQSANWEKLFAEAGKPQ